MFLQSHIEHEALAMNTPERKRKAEQLAVHSTQGDKLFNVLIYMAWSQFSVLNMLVLYFKPQAK